MDVKFIGILAQYNATVALSAARGDAGVESAEIFGHVDRTENMRLKLIETTLNLDDESRPANAVPIAEQVMAWENTFCSR